MPGDLFMQKADVLIVGGGVSGLTAAISAARTGEHPIILEKFDQPGKKLLATGNGRCNLINLNSPVYFGDKDFALSVIKENAVEVLTRFLHSIGILIRYDDQGRGYPCTFQAASVLDALKAEAKRLGIPILTGVQVTDVHRHSCGYSVIANNAETYSAPRLILSTGGAAQPRLGGNLDARRWLESLGHHFVSPSPSLTPICTDSRSVSGLAGIRVKCRLHVWSAQKEVHREQGELLFTENGISGICAMQCARYVLPGHSEIRVDLLPDLFPDADSLYQELLLRRSAFADESPPELLRGLCVPRLGYAICKQAGLSLRGETNRDLSDPQLFSLSETLHGYRLQVTGLEGFDRAQVMAGGVFCDEIRPDNLESRLCPGLYVTGELLNVDGDCGGYNLMFAFITGLMAGSNGGTP